jgi:choice-of-anchor B domain-containing protein
MTRNRLFFGFTLFFFSFVCPVFAQNFNMTQRAVLDFPGQNLANVWGYMAKGREYALVGGSRGLIIVEVTNTTAPVVIKQIPGVVNNWKEIKTYKNFAYVVSEGANSGVQIIDLTNLPDTTLAVKSYFGDGVIDGQLRTIHSLHIDEKKGFLYAHGSNLSSGGPIILDLKDPANPTFAGRYTQLGYVHDGFADNDTLYAGHIYTGTLAVVDMRDKANPKVLGSVTTPGKFTHNAWILSDRKTILTTDEATPSFVTAYNVSDPTDIKELDRFSTNNGLGSIGHNVHIQNDWAVTSWYTDGVSVVDAHRPQNLIETGRFDTWSGTGANFNGCWGVFPHFASGTIVASNINPAQLFVLTPSYQRAAYFEGRVRSSCDNLPLNDVTISIVKGQDRASEVTNQQGIFRTGHVNPGAYTVTISKAGFQTRTLTANLETAKVLEQDIVLEPLTSNNITGTVLDAETNQSPLAKYPPDHKCQRPVYLKLYTNRQL